MRITKKEEIFLVESSLSTPKKKSYYKVDIDKRTCTCPHYALRLKKEGGECKHIMAVRQLLRNDAKDDFDKALDLVNREGFVESIAFIERFSEGLLNELIEQGELIEDKGYIKRI